MKRFDFGEPFCSVKDNSEEATFVTLGITKCNEFRSQWPRGLRHGMSSPARTLGSWVRIPVWTWMFAFILFVLSYVSSGLATGWSFVEGVLPIVYKCKVKDLVRGGLGPIWAVSAIGWMDGSVTSIPTKLTESCRWLSEPSSYLHEFVNDMGCVKTASHQTLFWSTSYW
jgi:hypothetical protein